ncbi:3-oxoacyl-ACP reductase FabG [Sodalis ligni]|uniref:SDR family NAD(P)-dependent oxidoreductase n=1 Tax=Sodalis ligni TaxID=2697027 RepID=UPI00193F981D|nr:3-oxoacyl-ACP reductase family protein [Sodalis ligni]QWA11865.1 3-oxoacyl-ACP reductase FabG [Sodalis ligni]
MSGLTGKVALVTGGSRGIGRDAALALAKAGCQVAINYLQADEQARQVVDDIHHNGGQAIAFKGDISLPEQVNRIVLQTRGAFGEINILVNNAGIAKVQDWQDITPDDWGAVLAANLTSSFLMSHAVLPAMQRRGWGRVIMISSMAAQTGGVIGPHYAASKAGQLGLMHSYANLLAGKGVTVNAIAPALIETDMIKNNPKITPDLLPVKRFGKTEEVTAVLMMLLNNGYITGQTINVNGGWYMS